MEAETEKHAPRYDRPKLSLVADNVQPYGVDFYIGGMEGASDIDLLRANNITTVVNCAVNLDFNFVTQPLSPAEQTVSYGFGDIRYYKLGLIDGPSLLLDAALVLFVVPGALLGRWAVDRINQRLFEQLVIAATVVGAIQLLVR